MSWICQQNIYSVKTVNTLYNDVIRLSQIHVLISTFILHQLKLWLEKL